MDKLKKIKKEEEEEGKNHYNMGMGTYQQHTLHNRCFYTYITSFTTRETYFVDVK